MLAVRLDFGCVAVIVVKKRTSEGIAYAKEHQLLVDVNLVISAKNVRNLAYRQRKLTVMTLPSDVSFLYIEVMLKRAE
jgi:hypothetical protein